MACQYLTVVGQNSKYFSSSHETFSSSYGPWVSCPVSLAVANKVGRGVGAGFRMIKLSWTVNFVVGNPKTLTEK